MMISAFTPPTHTTNSWRTPMANSCMNADTSHQGNLALPQKWRVTTKHASWSKVNFSRIYTTIPSTHTIINLIPHRLHHCAAHAHLGGLEDGCTCAGLGCIGQKGKPACHGCRAHKTRRNSQGYFAGDGLLETTGGGNAGHQRYVWRTR